MKIKTYSSLCPAKIEMSGIPGKSSPIPFNPRHSRAGGNPGGREEEFLDSRLRGNDVLEQEFRGHHTYFMTPDEEQVESWSWAELSELLFRRFPTM